jgi:hypothetical protein
MSVDTTWFLYCPDVTIILVVSICPGLSFSIMDATTFPFVKLMAQSPHQCTLELNGASPRSMILVPLTYPPVGLASTFLCRSPHRTSQALLMRGVMKFHPRPVLPRIYSMFSAPNIPLQVTDWRKMQNACVWNFTSIQGNVNIQGALRRTIRKPL